MGDCCPSLSGLSATELAQLLREEAAYAELTHNFAHFNNISMWENDVDLLTLADATCARAPPRIVERGRPAVAFCSLSS